MIGKVLYWVLLVANIETRYLGSDPKLEKLDKEGKGSNKGALISRLS